MMPKLVERELDGYVGCGVLARGFARVRCGACGHELLVPLELPSYCTLFDRSDDEPWAARF